jgi:hypothetical protein
MKNITLFGILLVLAFVSIAHSKIAVIANRNLSTASKVAIRDFAENIEFTQDKTVWLDMTYYDETTSPAQLRSVLLNLYNDPNDKLEGAIFIGDLPIAYFEVQNDFNMYGYANFPCDFYFMDLNGTWADNATNGMWGGNAHTGFFDDHSGNIAAEIWVSRLVPGAIPSISSDENIALSYYMPRLQSRMAGGTENVTRRELIVGNDVEGWDPVGWGGASLLGYGSNVTRYLRSSAAALDSRDNLAAGLQNGYEYTLVCEHASPVLFNTSINDFLNTTYLYMPTNSNCRFYNLFACSACRYVVDDCLGALMGQSHCGLFCMGTTKTGSMLQFDYYNTPLGADSCSGAAFKKWANQVALYTGRSSNEISWHYGMTLLGPGNLRIRPYSSVSSLFKQAAVGNPPLRGSYSYSNYTFTINGSGADIWGTSDQFGYVYHALNGDGQIVAGVYSIENINALAKAGVMIRESLEPNSREFSLILTKSGLIQAMYRTTTGGSTSGPSSSCTVPYYLKIVRSGNVFTAFKSSNSRSWTAVGTAQTISMNQNALIGLAVCSHTPNTLCKAVFNSVTFPAQQLATRTNFNIPKYQFVTGGNKDFQAYDAYSICSGSMTDNQESRIKLVTTAQYIGFNWKVDSELNYDFLRLYCNGMEQASISGNQNWVSYVCYGWMPVNCYEIVYTKDYSVSVGQDRGWVKDLVQW